AAGGGRHHREARGTAGAAAPVTQCGARRGGPPVAGQQPQLPGGHLMRGVDLNDRRVALAVDGAGAGDAPVAAAAARDAAALSASQAAALQSLLGEDAPAALWVSLSPPLQPDLPGELLRQLRAG